MFPHPVALCLDTLRGNGFSAYPVGGCVRDTLLGRTPGDWDVATSARPEQTQSLFPRTVPTGIAHGTVTVLLEDTPLEVTTFRREEGYGDGRHPDRVSFDVGLTADLARRDFTVNAMAFGPDGEVIDPYGGQADLSSRLIRAVGDPERRFAEDALRILRAIRFAAQLGFSLEENTARAMEVCAPGLYQVSAERIVAELHKTLLSPAPHWAGEFFRLGAMARFGCEVKEADWPSLSAVPRSKACRWPALCALTGLDITALPISRAIRRAVLHPHAGEEKNLSLSGADLAAMGFQGPKIGEVQRALLAHVLAHPADDRPDTLRALALKLQKQRQE